VVITEVGKRQLGSALGTDEFLNSYMFSTRWSFWVGEMKKLSEIAITQPQAAYTAFTHVFYIIGHILFKQYPCPLSLPST